MSATAMPLRIDIVSDVVCPWCVIGYKQLLVALDQRADQLELDLHWHPFELNPQMPPEGQNLREHIQQKYGSSREQSQGARQRLQELGDTLGFKFNYSDETRMVNTFRAHQLLHWAGEQGKQTELQMVLFEAFFTLQQDVNDPAVLIEAATRVGLSAEAAAAVLVDASYGRAVREEQQGWLEEGIQAVPCFIVNNKYMVQGAQESAAFGRMLDKLLASHADSPAMASAPV